MHISKLILIVGALTASSLGYEVSAMPKLDPAGKCGARIAVEAPTGDYFRTCSEFNQAADGTWIETRVVEKFLPTGALDPSWGNMGFAIQQRAPVGQTVVCSGRLGLFYFPPDGRVLVNLSDYLNGDSLQAFLPSGAIDTGYGLGGISAPFCRDSAGVETVLSTDMRIDGSFDIISNVSQPSQNGGAINFFRARRILASGLTDRAFGANADGVADYRGIPYLDAPNADRTIAWSLQGDGTLEVAYFQALDPLSPTTKVLRQHVADSNSTIATRQILPRLAYATHIADANITGNVRIIVAGDGDVFFYYESVPSNAESSAQLFRQYVARFKPDGQLDKLFGADGVRQVSGSTIPTFAETAGFSMRFSGDLFLQGDGSLVYDGGVSGHRGGTIFGINYPSVQFSWKLDPDGNLDLAFPQWSNPATSGAVIQRGSLGWTMVEYYNANLDRYFMTPHAAEQAYIADNISYHDAGWRKTGRTFGVWDPASTMPGTASACRFAADPIVPPKTFFDSIKPEDCNFLRQLELATPPGQRAWRYDRESFRAAPPVNGNCAATLLPIYGLYNLGAERGVDADFRYVGSLTDYDAMIARGWVGSKVPQFCARPDR